MRYRGGIICRLLDEDGNPHESYIELEGITTDEKPELAMCMALTKAGEIAAERIDTLLAGRLIITGNGAVPKAVDAITGGFKEG